ncbi:hypothetical protein [Dactylosporangium sp. CS-033363]
MTTHRPSTVTAAACALLLGLVLPATPPAKRYFDPPIPAPTG